MRRAAVYNSPIEYSVTVPVTWSWSGHAVSRRTHLKHGSYQHLLKRLNAFARVIVFDKRGQGLSDRAAKAEQTLEERIIDIRAVMDAANSIRALVYGWSEGGPASLMFSATYPERTPR